MVPWTRLRKDEDDNVVGVLPQAYQRRDGEDALSVNWIERVGGEPELQLRRTAELLRAGLKIGSKARLAVSGAGLFKDVCRSNGASVRIVHEPEEGNEPHSSIRQIPRDDLILLDAIAREAVESHVSFGEILGPT